MKKINSYRIEAAHLAADLAIALNKSRGILDSYPDDASMQLFGKGIQSTARQLIKWQIWNNPAFKPLIIKEYRIVKNLYPYTEN